MMLSLPLLAAFLLAAVDLEEAERLFAAGRHAEARAAYEAVLGDLEGAQRAAVLDRIGSTRLAEGDVWGAETDFAASLDAMETFAARLHRGQALYFAGRSVAGSPGALGAEVVALMNDAATQLARATEISTGEAADRAEAFVYLGLTERYVGSPEREEKAYRQALEIAPGRPDAALYLAWLLERGGSLRQASEVLGSVPEESRQADHWLALGRIARAEGEADQASDRFARAISTSPFLVDGYEGLYDVTVRRKRYREFEKVAAEVIGRTPDCWLAHYYLGFCRREAGRPREAMQSFEESFRLNPEEVRARLLVAEVLLVDLKDETAAIPVYLDVLANQPGEGRARVVLATLASKAADRRDFATARTVLATLIEADPSEWAYRTNLAVIERDAGNPEEALAIFTAAEEQYPIEPQIPNDRGLLLMGLGRREEAMAAFRLALERDEDCLDALENLGSYTLLGGDPTGAIPFFRRAFERARVVGGDASKFRRYLDDAFRAGQR
jgi:tetratricopeptide (TPR) repeat protein